MNAAREAASKAFYECEGNNKACLKAAFDAYEATPLIAAAPDMLGARIAKLEEVLADLLSWFAEKPSDPEWRIKAGAFGADDAIQAARAALVEASQS